jgi:branched-chain amino acid transport system ATP-binding protein
VTPALSVGGLHVYLGESHVLQGISFDVPSGGVTALLGRNGVGKTTTLRALMGLVPRSRGSIALAGDDVTRLATHAVVRHGVGYVPEDRDVFAGLTVEENLRLAERSPSPRYDLVHDLFPELRERARQRAGTLSGGQQQMVTKGLAPLLVTDVAAALERAAELTTILLVEQNLRVVQRVAQDVVVLDGGRVVHTGPAEELLSDPAHVRRLLGVHGSAA